MRAWASTQAAKLDAGLVEECYARSLQLLRDNCTPDGILACAPSDRARARRYTSVFGRDAAICALGMLASGERDLIACARRSLSTLAAHQAPNGQIPKYVAPETDEADFWYLGCIDATLWWLIALKHLGYHADRSLPGESFATAVRHALDWLLCQEHQRFHLLQQNEASDWADIMPRSGFVLYTNALWYWVKRLYGLPEAERSRQYFNRLFMPAAETDSMDRRADLLARYVLDASLPGDTYLSFVNFSFWGEEVDVFGNILALLAGLPWNRAVAGRVVAALRALEVDRPYPVRAVGHPIETDNPLWRRYMERHRQNFPYQYHNGGIWPFIGGFWVILLARQGMDAEAGEALTRLAQLNRSNDWEFNEWFHGSSGAALGMPRQSWNAAMFVLAYQTLRRRDAGLWLTTPPNDAIWI